MIEIDANILVETEHLGSNNGIVCTRDGLVLIDSPHRPTDALRWRRIVDGLGRTEFLINTDHHPDHTIGNFFLPGRVIAHAGTRERLINNAPTAQYLADLIAVIDPKGIVYMRDYAVRLPTVTFTERMSLSVGSVDFELVYMRGHTLNNIVVHIPAQGVVFTGDLVCEAGLPAFIEADTFAWVETVRAIEAMNVRTIVPGHGKVCGREQARIFRGWMEDLIGEVTRRMDEGVPRDRIADLVSYEDRIHISTGGSPAYPDHLITLFMRKSIEAIFDHVSDRRLAAAA